MEGVTVVIPKKHRTGDVLALPDDELSKFVVTAKRVANILLEYFDDVGRVGMVMDRHCSDIQSLLPRQDQLYSN